MSTIKLSSFKKYNDRGNMVLQSELRGWRDPITGSDVFGPIIAYSWEVEGEHIRLDDPESRLSVHPLPDCSGFIVFEPKRWEPDNCLLLDVYGKQRMRLTVPVELAGSVNPDSAKAPTSFGGLSEPYVNPADGKPGNFGVEAWVEHAGKYYFELDYHSGKFLWGKPIRD